jgi:hypothetical protein
MTDVAPTELGKLLRNMFYKHSAPLALVDQRVCQQYLRRPAFTRITTVFRW